MINAPRAKLRDRTGWPIPDTIAERWQQADTATFAALRDIGRWRNQFDKLHNQPGVQFGRANAGKILMLLRDACSEINLAVPYAVCTSCQGMLFDQCTFCAGYGYISQSVWETDVPPEDKQMRAIILKGGA